MIISIGSMAWADKQKYIYIYIFMNWVDGGSCSDRHSLLRGRIYIYLFFLPANACTPRGEGPAKQNR